LPFAGPIAPVEIGYRTSVSNGADDLDGVLRTGFGEWSRSALYGDDLLLDLDGEHATEGARGVASARA